MATSWLPETVMGKKTRLSTKPHVTYDDGAWDIAPSTIPRIIAAASPGLRSRLTKWPYSLPPPGYSSGLGRFLSDLDRVLAAFRDPNTPAGWKALSTALGITKAEARRTIKAVGPARALVARGESLRTQDFELNRIGWVFERLAELRTASNNPDEQILDHAAAIDSSLIAVRSWRKAGPYPPGRFPDDMEATKDSPKVQLDELIAKLELASSPSDVMRAWTETSKYVRVRILHFEQAEFGLIPSREGVLAAAKELRELPELRGAPNKDLSRVAALAIKNAFRSLAPSRNWLTKSCGKATGEGIHFAEQVFRQYGVEFSVKLLERRRPAKESVGAAEGANRNSDQTHVSEAMLAPLATALCR